jgi:hypothetical protein
VIPGTNLAKILPSLSLTPPSLFQPPINTPAISTSAPQPYLAERQALVPQTSSLSPMSSRGRSGLVRKEKVETASETMQSASPATLQPPRHATSPQNRASHTPSCRPLCTDARWRHICVLRHEAPEPLPPSCAGARQQTRNLTLAPSCPLVDHTVHEHDRTAPAPEPNPPLRTTPGRITLSLPLI